MTVHMAFLIQTSQYNAPQSIVLLRGDLFLEYSNRVLLVELEVFHDEIIVLFGLLIKSNHRINHLLILFLALICMHPESVYLCIVSVILCALIQHCQSFVVFLTGIKIPCNAYLWKKRRLVHLHQFTIHRI